MKEREHDSLRQVALWCFQGRARASISGEDMVSRLASTSDSCALVRGPKAGASCEDAGPISVFTPSSSPSLSTCSVQGAILIKDGYEPGIQVGLTLAWGLPGFHRLGSS